jgi:hypothetical protein
MISLETTASRFVDTATGRVLALACTTLLIGAHEARGFSFGEVSSQNERGYAMRVRYLRDRHALAVIVAAALKKRFLLDSEQFIPDEEIAISPGPDWEAVPALFQEITEEDILRNLFVSSDKDDLIEGLFFLPGFVGELSARRLDAERFSYQIRSSITHRTMFSGVF